MHQSFEGILLKRTNYGEDDLVVVLLTPQGVETFFAKSARKSRKRFGGQLDFFRRLKFSASKRTEQGWYWLEQCEAVEVWESLWTQSEKYPVACAWIDLLRQLLMPMKDVPIYEYALSSLRYLAETPARHELPQLDIRFQLRLSMQLGFGPNFLEGFGTEKDSVSLSSESLLWLSEYQSSGRPRALLSGFQVAEIERMLLAHWRHLGVEPLKQ